MGFPSAKPNFGATLTPKLTPEIGLTLTEGFDQSEEMEVCGLDGKTGGVLRPLRGTEQFRQL